MGKIFNPIFKFFTSAYFIITAFWIGSAALMVFATTPSPSDAYFIYQNRQSTETDAKAYDEFIKTHKVVAWVDDTTVGKWDFSKASNGTLLYPLRNLGVDNSDEIKVRVKKAGERIRLHIAVAY
jgi:hypothetical protein